MTEREKVKFRYVLDTCLAIYDALQFHKCSGEEEFWQSVDKAGWAFDWDQVVRTVSPEILIVMSGDRRDPSRHPVYLVVPGAGEWFEIDAHTVEELLRDVVPFDRGVTDFDQSVELIRKMIQDGPTDRTGEAMKHLNALKRIIRPTL
jgi:hypothetical protein